MKSIMTILIGILLIAAGGYIPTATLAQNDEMTEPETAPHQDDGTEPDQNNPFGDNPGTEPFGPSPDEDDGLTPPDEDDTAQEIRGPIYDR